MYNDALYITNFMIPINYTITKVEKVLGKGKKSVSTFQYSTVGCTECTTVHGHVILSHSPCV